VAEPPSRPSEVRLSDCPVEAIFAGPPSVLCVLNWTLFQPRKISGYAVPFHICRILPPLFHAMYENIVQVRSYDSQALSDLSSCTFAVFILYDSTFSAFHFLSPQARSRSFPRFSLPFLRTIVSRQTYVLPTRSSILILLDRFCNRLLLMVFPFFLTPNFSSNPRKRLPPSLNPCSLSQGPLLFLF